jgi:hypothetical protein
MSHLTTTKKYGPLYAQVMVSYLAQGKYRSYTFPLAT